MSGIFIANGATLSIRGISLSIGENGNVSPINVNLGLDVCTPWFEIALEHLKNARDFNRTLMASDTPGQINGEAMRSEFKSAMQVIAASGFAFDAVYEALKGKLPEAARPKKERPRFLAVANTLKTAFQQSDNGYKITHDYLKQIYNFRNKAVHPSNDFNAPLLHPELKVGVEWRFITYRYAAAQPLLFVSLKIVRDLCAHGRPLNDEVQKYATYLTTMLNRLGDDPIFDDLRKAANAASNTSAAPEV